MPWKETCAVEEKLLLIADWLKGELTMTALCERHEVSRKTGYKWIERYAGDPEHGLQERSRAPQRVPWSLDLALAKRILALRRRRPHWGPRKLLARLELDHPGEGWPAASTIGDLLRREGLSQPRRMRRPGVPVKQPFGEVKAPNDVWCTDFKGWFRTQDGQRCDPLTLTDAHSRFLLECRIVAPTGDGARPRFIRAFKEYGLPRAIRSDNGAPFGSTGAGGLTRLSVEWLKLGIKLERIDPGNPQQNGRHERMHRTLKAETSHPPAETPSKQQRRFDRFRKDYNEQRPHEALDQQLPADHYHASSRRYPDRVPEPWYDADHQVRRVRADGEIKWRGGSLFIAESLAGDPVGIAELETGNHIVRFIDVDLGVIDRDTGKFRRFAAARPGRSKA
jgi:transposase InsO family protein